MRLFKTAVPMPKARTETSAVPSPLPGVALTSEYAQTPFPSARIRGFVDRIAGGEVRGWIIDEADPNRYIKLCLFANGRYIEKTTTCIFRKDLEQLFQSKGLHGFAFRLPEELYNSTEITVEIRLEDGRCLCKATVLQNHSPEEKTNGHRKPCLLVMHIPKTAVTAIRSALRSDWLTDRHLWLYADAPGFPAEHLLYLTERQLSRAECIFGHFSFDLHRYIPQASKYATILRDPVDRCISHYCHERAKAADPDAPARKLTLDELLESQPDFTYDNLMVRMLTGKAGIPFGAVTRDVLREAIENIHQHFCYVGFQQRTSEAVKSLARYLNLQPNPLQQENLGSYDREKAQLSVCRSTPARA